MHPAVADAKLVAMPDDFYGEKGCVYIILRPDHKAPDVKGVHELPRWQRARRDTKCPERIEVIDQFP